MLENNDKIIDFSKAKETKKIEIQSNSFKGYLTVLSFSELINEVNHLIKDINDNSLTREITTKSRAIFKELYSRIENESHDLAESIKSMKKDLDKSISRLF